MSNPDYRLIDIKLDERTILWRNADIEQERRVAIFDLLEGNEFKPIAAADAGHHAGTHRTFCVRFDAVDQGIAGIDVDAGVLVRQGGVAHGWGIRWDAGTPAAGLARKSIE